MASVPGPVMEFLGRIAYEAQIMQPLLPTYLHLLISAIFPIYAAAHASLSRPSSAAPPAKRRRRRDDESDEEKSQLIESLTPSDALLFPLLAGATLASLYFILKWLQDPAWLNWALGLYFSQIGLFFAMKFIKDALSVARSVLLPVQYSAAGQVWRADQEACCFVAGKDAESGSKRYSPLPSSFGRIPLPMSINSTIWRIRNLVYNTAKLQLHIHKVVTIKAPVDMLDLLSILLSGAVVAYHTFIAKPWFLTNFLGFSFCYGSLQFMTPTTAWTGTLVLGALFFYDIYFVFYTPMMVTVATKLDVPIKLLFPRPDGCILPVGAAEGSAAMEEYLQCLAKKRTMAMLGLGDIVVPGMILAFALRFDLYLFYLRRTKTTSSEVVKSESKDKPLYLPAKGGWGERFWTKGNLQSDRLRAKQFPKIYFYATIIGYLIGMITTVIVMQIAEHAQPALLYLVPGVLTALWSTALLKGDLQTLWNFTEAPEEEKSTEESKDESLKNEGNGVQKNVAVSTPNNTEDGELAVADAGPNNTSAAEGNGEVKITSPEQTEASKDDPEKSCRQLIHFSITRSKDKSNPATATSVRRSSRTNETKQSKTPAIFNEETSSEEDAEQEKEMALSNGIGHESKPLTRSAARSSGLAGAIGEDEPPGKRRRKA